MKLFSSKGKKSKGNGRKISKDTQSKSKPVNDTISKSKPVNDTIEKSERKERGRSSSTKKKVLVTVSCLVGMVLLLGASTFAVVRWEIQPFYDFLFRPGMEVLAEPPRANVVFAVEPEDPEEPAKPVVVADPISAPEEVPEETRNMSKFTFLIFGLDEYGNTDVIMVAAFDEIESTLDVVSIPRDTLVNVSWNLKKANSIQPTMRNRHRNHDDAESAAMQATIEQFRSILGFDVDFWVTLNMRAFVSLVNAVGPILFNVPRGIEGVPSGNQRLNGQQALQVVRQRALYSNADIGRVNTQQNFLKAVANTILANRGNVNPVDMANVFIGNVKTDIQLNHLVWLGREFLKMNSESVNFTMMPGAMDSARGQSYITIFVDEWLEIVNSKLSPLTREITSEDVSILTRGADRRLYVTDGNWEGDPSWGASSRGPGTSGGNTTTPGTTGGGGG